MIEKKIFDKYNQEETLAIISLYPQKGEIYSAGVSGIASYTKNLVTHFSRPVIVIADYQETPADYQEGNSLVLRCFQFQSSKSWWQMLKTLHQFTKVKQILIQFDFSMYGDILTSSLMIPFISILRILGFQVSLVSHSVVLDVSRLSGHIGLGNSFSDKLKGKVLNFIFETFYFIVGILVNRLIVLEENLINRISKLVLKNKIRAISHAVDTSLETISKKEARRELNIEDDEYVVMFFGFVNWFKGADFFAKTFSSVSKMLGKNIRFIIAGGESSTLKNKKYYQNYYKEIQNTVNNSENLTLTGYVPKEKIQTYFSAVDLVVFPYRYFMCASGVLSLVFAYRKPFIVSEALSEMFTSSDLQHAMKVAKLTPEEMSFSFDAQSCIERTEKVLENGIKAKMIKLAEIMRESRSFKKSAATYEQVIFEKKEIKEEFLNQDLSYSHPKITVESYQLLN